MGRTLAVGTAVDVLVALKWTRLLDRDHALAVRAIERTVSDHTATVPLKPPGRETQNAQNRLSCLFHRVFMDDELLNPPLGDPHDDREDQCFQSRWQLTWRLGVLLHPDKMRPFQTVRIKFDRERERGFRER